VSTLGGGLIALLGAAGSAWTVPVGAVLSGATAVLGGLYVMHRALPWRRAETFRVLIGLSALIWGAGQVLVGVLVHRGAGYPNAGDLVSLFAAPLALAGLAIFPRRVVEPRAGLRLACDSLVVGGASAAFVWRLGFTHLVDPSTAGGAMSVVIIMVELSVVALLAVAALRELDSGAVAAAVGFAAFVGADLWTQQEVMQPGGRWPWGAMVLTCLAWPAICVGLVQVSTAPRELTDRERPAAERRRTVVTSATTAAVTLGLLALLLRDRDMDTVTVVLLASSAAAVAVREIVVAGQSAGLLERVSDLAFLDPLTELGNRRALVEALHTGTDAGQQWLLTVDLDNFKGVNSLLGHTAGDQLLERAASHLRALSGEQSTFRLGGDEFAVIVTGARADAEGLGTRLVEGVRLAALSVPGVGRVALSASVGVAPVDPADPGAVLAQSAAALQSAKAAGRNRCVVYADDVAAADSRRRLVEIRLRETLAEGGLAVHAQPVVSLADGRVVGVEMLARWTDPELGVVGPDEFIEVAEASALVVPLGEAVLDLALAAAADLHFADRDLTMGVNVSPVQLRVPGFADRVVARLSHYGVPSDRLVVELTEQIFVTEGDAAELELHRLAALGVTVAVDDFGAGSASLGYLRRIPARILKLDRSLVASMLVDPSSAAIVRSTAWLAAETGLDVVAEGIEDEATAAACRAAGVPFAQGWLYARAVPLDELDALVADLDRRSSSTLAY
jgi:diguanylate cyclase (GGDEF)-like protein